MTTDPLLDAIDALTRPRRTKLFRDDGSSDTVEIPALLDQLQDEIGTGQERSDRGGAFGSRLPMVVDIRDTLADWNDSVRYELLSCEITPHADGGLRKWLMQIATATPPAPLEPPDLDRWGRQVAKWVLRAEDLLGLVEVNRPRKVRDTLCPLCRATHCRVDEHGQVISAGTLVKPEDVYRAPALLMLFVGTILQSVECSCCGHAWFGKSGIWEVGELLDGQRRRDAEARTA